MKVLDRLKTIFKTLGQQGQQQQQQHQQQQKQQQQHNNSSSNCHDSSNTVRIEV